MQTLPTCVNDAGQWLLEWGGAWRLFVLHGFRHKVPGFSSFRLPGFLPLFVKVPLFEVSGIQ